jgi:hypothetical protein
MPSAGQRGDRHVPTVLLDLPFTGLWLTRNSPAARVPSHGTDLFGTTYAIDFVASDLRRRTAELLAHPAQHRTRRALHRVRAPDPLAG